MKTVICAFLVASLAACTVAPPPKPMDEKAIDRLAKQLAHLNESFVEMTERGQKPTVVPKQVGGLRMVWIPATNMNFDFTKTVKIGDFDTHAVFPMQLKYKPKDKAQLTKVIEKALAAKEFQSMKVAGWSFKTVDVGSYWGMPIHATGGEIAPKPAQRSSLFSSFEKFFRDELLAMQKYWAESGIRMKGFTVQLGLPPKVTASFEFK